jgi:hypothetical protein
MLTFQSLAVFDTNVQFIKISEEINKVVTILCSADNKLSSKPANFYIHDAWLNGTETEVELDVHQADKVLGSDGVEFYITTQASALGKALIALASMESLKLVVCLRFNGYSLELTCYLLILHLDF